MYESSLALSPENYRNISEKEQIWAHVQLSADTGIHPILFPCWPNVFDAGPTLLGIGRHTAHCLIWASYHSNSSGGNFKDPPSRHPVHMSQCWSNVADVGPTSRHRWCTCSPPPVIRSSCASSDLKPRIRHLTYHVTMTYDGKFEDVWKSNLQKPESKRQVSSRQNNYLPNVTATIQIIAVILWRIIYLIKWNWEYKYFDA